MKFHTSLSNFSVWFHALSFSLTSLYYFVALTPFVFAMDNYTSAAPKTTPR